MLVKPNYENRDILKKHIREGKTVNVFDPSQPTAVFDGRVKVIGPHDPPQTWWAEVHVVNNRIIRVI